MSGDTWTLRCEGPKGKSVVVLTDTEASAVLAFLDAQRAKVVFVMTKDEAQALWDKLCHDAHGYDEKAQKVRTVLNRISRFLEPA